MMNKPIKLANEEPSEKFPSHLLNDSWRRSRWLRLTEIV
jgi:hypothetical protein